MDSTAVTEELAKLRLENGELKRKLGAAGVPQIPLEPTTLPELLRQQDTVYGTCITSTSPKWVPAIAACGLDFVFIDTEHIPIDRATLSWMCNSYKLAGLPPLVRIPEPDPYQATMVIDGGACGVVAPYMETVEQVKALRGAVKLRPYKGQRLQVDSHHTIRHGAVAVFRCF